MEQKTDRIKEAKDAIDRANKTIKDLASQLEAKENLLQEAVRNYGRINNVISRELEKANKEIESLKASQEQPKEGVVLDELIKWIDKQLQHKNNSDGDYLWLGIFKDKVIEFQSLQSITPSQPEVGRERICDKCNGEIRRTHISPCPTDGLKYCEKCIDPEEKIYNDEYFRK